MRNTTVYDTVFIVDDDRTISLLHHQIIKKTGIGEQIMAFANPLEALGELRRQLQSSHKHILVLLDINMPEMSGFEFLEAIPQFAKKKSMMDVLMVTSSINRRDMEKSSKNPLVNRYITKPLKKEDIVEFAQNRSLISA